jgi:hypothetical protein
MSIEKEILHYMGSVGAVLVRSKRHNVWRLPNGRVVVTSQSPSDFRVFKNIVRDVKRALA